MSASGPSGPLVCVYQQDVQACLFAALTDVIFKVPNSHDSICSSTAWIVISVVVFVFNVPPTAKVKWRWGHGLKSPPTDW